MNLNIDMLLLFNAHVLMSHHRSKLITTVYSRVIILHIIYIYIYIYTSELLYSHCATWVIKVGNCLLTCNDITYYIYIYIPQNYCTVIVLLG